MQRLLVLTLVSTMALGSMCLVACGGEGENTPAQEESDETIEEPTEDETEEPTAEATSSEFTWDDVPVYPGAEADQSSWTSVEMDGTKIETHLYTTTDSSDDVVDFYRSEMPDNGWEDAAFVQSGNVAQAAFTKHDEQDTATILIDCEEEVVTISLTRTHEDE